MLKPDLYDRFEQAQINILSAVLHGPSALSNFQKDWSQLTSDLDEEIRLRQVDQEVMDMAHATASVVSMLAHSFLNLHNKASNAYDNLTKELLDTLNGSASQPASSRLQSDVPFQSAFDWLANNLHDPYPSPAMKIDLAQSSAVSVESISAWFDTARERIGWTTLMRHHFNGRRSAIVDAAYRALVAPDPDRSLPPTLKHAFSIMKKNLEIIRPATVSQDQSSKGQQLEITYGLPTGMTIEGELMKHAKASHYLTEPSTYIVSELSAPDQQVTHWHALDEEDTTPPPPIAGSKRRAEPGFDTNDVFQVNRPLKRRKSNSLPLDASVLCPLSEQPDDVAIPHLSSHLDIPKPLSPASVCLSEPKLALDLPIVDPLPPPFAPFISQSSTTSTGSRKRRLSDASCETLPKRPRHGRAPRLHAVSDPLPRGTSEDASNNILLENWHDADACPAPELFSGVPSNPSSAVTTAVNSPFADGLCNDLYPIPIDFFDPSQLVDLSDEAFQSMLASACDVPSGFIPVDHGILEMLPSLDDLFPPSPYDLSKLLCEQSAQCTSHRGFNAGIPFTVEGHNLNFDAASYHIVSPTDGILLDQKTSINTIGFQELDDWSTTVCH